VQVCDREVVQDEHHAALNASLNDDAHWTDLPWSDAEFAWQPRQRLIARLTASRKDQSVHPIVAVTHVRIFEEQMSNMGPA
jgi:hypothetical protein